MRSIRDTFTLHNVKQIVSITALREKQSINVAYYPAKTNFFGKKTREAGFYFTDALIAEDWTGSAARKYSVTEIEATKKYKVLDDGTVFLLPCLYFTFSDGSTHLKYFSTYKSLEEYLDLVEKDLHLEQL